MADDKASQISFPERLALDLDDLTEWVNAKSPSAEVCIRWSSLYGLLLASAYGLCESYYRLVAKQAVFQESSHYFKHVRLTLHRHLTEVAEHGDTSAFDTELVGLHVNASQHFLHFLLDRLLNILIQRAFERNEQEMTFVFYNFVGMRVSLLRWRLAEDRVLQPALAELDTAFTRWSRSYQAGSCNDFVRKILNNPEVKPPPDSLGSLLDGVRFTFGNDAGNVAGSLAYIVDRTNEAKHLPDGAGRAKLASEQAEPKGVRRLYEVEWVITFLAFREMVSFVRLSLQYLSDGQAAVTSTAGTKSADGG